MKTMTLNLNEREMAILEQLAEQKDLSKTAVIRQALRMYQMIDTRLASGGRLWIDDPSETNMLATEKQLRELLIVS